MVGSRAPIMQVGVFSYGVIFKDTLKVDGELKRIHCGNCELAERQDDGQ